jgi:hypothetical protein
VTDNLPEFAAGRLYLIRGATANLIKAGIRKNRPCATTGGGISLVSQTKDGSFIRGAAQGQGGGTSTAGDNLPQFDPKKVYLLSDKTVAAMFAAARTNHTKVVTNTGLTIPSDSPRGVVVGSSA